MSFTVAILATLDTKGDEAAFLKAAVEDEGCAALLVDFGLYPPLRARADVTREQVLAAIGEPADGLVHRRGRDEALRLMTQALIATAQGLARQQRVHGLVALGGSVGTAVATAVMAALPLPLPKVLVTTVPTIAARGGAASDVVVVPSWLDLAGLNRGTRTTLRRAAAVVCGAAAVPREERGRPVVLLTSLGVVTPAALNLRELFAKRGMEVAVFHGHGTRARVLGEFLGPEEVAGEVRLAHTELYGQLLGGGAPASPEAAPGDYRHPLVAVPGALDLIVTGSERAQGPGYAERKVLEHTPAVRLLRVTKEEARHLAQLLVGRTALHPGPRAIAVPTGGFSMHSGPGQPFDDPAVDAAFIESLLKHAAGSLPVQLIDAHINAPTFAEAVVALLERLGERR